MRTDVLHDPPAARDYVSVNVAGQLFGLPIERVRQVFRPTGVTPVPLAPDAVAGLINLRGRVVTAIDLRRRLGLPPRGAAPCMAAGLESGEDPYGLLVDEIGDVIRVDAATLIDGIAHLPPRWQRLAAGIHRMKDGLMIVLDVDAVLALDVTATDSRRVQ